MCELCRNSDLVECGVDEYEHLKAKPKAVKKAKEPKANSKSENKPDEPAK